MCDPTKYYLLPTDKQLSNEMFVLLRYYPDWEEMCRTLDMNTHIPKPVVEEKEAEKVEQKEEEKKEEDKEKVGGGENTPNTYQLSPVCIVSPLNC